MISNGDELVATLENVHALISSLSDTHPGNPELEDALLRIESSLRYLGEQRVINAQKIEKYDVLLSLATTKEDRWESIPDTFAEYHGCIYAYVKHVPSQSVWIAWLDFDDDEIRTYDNWKDALDDDLDPSICKHLIKPEAFHEWKMWNGNWPPKEWLTQFPL